MAALLACVAVSGPALAASQLGQSIEFARSSWGRTVMSWKISPDGSGWRRWTDQAVPQRDEYVTYTQRFKLSVAQRAEIEQLLRPTQAFAGRDCHPTFTDAGTYELHWGPGTERSLSLYAACSDAWTKDVYRRIGAANEKMKLWAAKAPVEKAPSDYHRIPLGDGSLNPDSPPVP